MATSAEDPLAADRRTLVIGATAMVGFILIGVVSAQVFARGGCVTVVEPRAATASAAMAPADVLTDHLGIDGGAAVSALEQVLGGPVTAVGVDGATGLAPVDGGLVATGPTTTSLDAALQPVATFDTGDLVLGDGPALFDAAVVNERTGQTDAFVPVTGTGLEPGPCVDAAVVGTPFAFLLDAGGGELLLLRLDEEGGDATLELRGQGAQIAWGTALPLPAGPPGTLAERVTAGLGPDSVVVARRVATGEAVAAPALLAVDRGDGAVRFHLTAQPLARAARVPGGEAVRFTVLAVGPDGALVAAHQDPADGAVVGRDVALVHVDLTAGEPTMVAPAVPAPTLAIAGPDGFAVATDGGGDSRIHRVVDGRLAPVGTAPGEIAALTFAGDDLFIATDQALLRDGPEIADAAAFDVPVADVVVTDDGRVAVLLRDGDRAVVVVGPPGG